MAAGFVIAIVCGLEVIQFIHFVNKNDHSEGPYNAVTRQCLSDDSPYKQYLNDFIKVNQWQYEHYEDRAWAMFFLALFILVIDIVLILLATRAAEGD